MPIQPNILLILTDQHRRDALGCYGNAVCRTPHIDALAAEGVRFDCAFTNTAICTAARATLLTGLEPHQHGMLANFERNVGYPWELPERLIPFSVYLREQGYRCGLAGKWHVSHTRGPEEFGFEGEHYPGWDGPVDHPAYLTYLEAHGLPRFRVRDEVRGVFPNGKPSLPMGGIYEGPLEGTYTYYLAEQAIARLRAYAADRRVTGRPFFLRLDLFGPHLPYYLPQAYADLYDPGLVERSPSMAETFAGKPQVQRWYNLHWAFDTYPWETWRKVVAMYWGYVTMIDEQIGRVLAALDELGLREETAVFFGADHGGFVGGHRLADKGPMMYDDIYRIPMVARWPGQTPRGAVCETMVTLMDLMPTFVEMAGAPVPAYVAGRSLAPLLRGETPADWPEEVLLQFHGHHFPYPQRGIRTRTHKLVVNPPDVNELYDLVADPHELNNVYDNPRYAAVRRELLGRLYRHLVASGDNFHHWMATMCEVDGD